ncbi:hypothetical protein GY45DRAFT_1327309 [Cubamyces sp. BRFM 1775]|nr:hypothetical protein GY45DRAFT_1327309 [Cubamyces sp. BRFM 1775]
MRECYCLNNALLMTQNTVDRAWAGSSNVQTNLKIPKDRAAFVKDGSCMVSVRAGSWRQRRLSSIPCATGSPHAAGGKPPSWPHLQAYMQGRVKQVPLGWAGCAISELAQVKCRLGDDATKVARIHRTSSTCWQALPRIVLLGLEESRLVDTEAKVKYRLRLHVGELICAVCDRGHADMVL